MLQGVLPFILLVIVTSIMSSVNASKKKQEAQRLAKAKERIAQEKAGKERAADKTVRREAPRTDRKPLAPTLHDHSGMFDGSLYADDGTEGRDPGDLTMPSARSETDINASLTGKAAPGAKRPAILPEFTGGNLARAFVLQEILKRPGQR